MIEVRNISKNFGRNQVLHNISFTLDTGVTAFLGANGAGKTTTMNILAGVLDTDRGEILIDNTDLGKEPIKVKRKIGYLPENNPLYEDMYVCEYLEYVARIYLPSKAVKQSIEEVIEKVDLANEYKKKIQALSYGNKQRVGLAQALVHNPDILILDEPSNGLDPIQQQRINNLITELGKSKIVLFSSHRLDDVSDIASRYLILKEGNLILDEYAHNIESIKQYFYQTET